MAVNKDKTIMLAAWPLTYEVKTVTNSVSFKPGEQLNRDAVLALCVDPDWEVTICSVDLLHLIPLPFVGA
jgi:hypothetical protein